MLLQDESAPAVAWHEKVHPLSVALASVQFISTLGAVVSMVTETGPDFTPSPPSFTADTCTVYTPVFLGTSGVKLPLLAARSRPDTP